MRYGFITELARPQGSTPLLSPHGSGRSSCAEDVGVFRIGTRAVSRELPTTSQAVARQFAWQAVDENGFPLLTDAKVELGKILFYENRLAGDASISCADCHSDEFGWTDGGDLCRGYTGTSHWRNCQTIINSAYYGKLFWDGTSNSLEALAFTAASDPVSVVASSYGFRFI